MPARSCTPRPAALPIFSVPMSALRLGALALLVGPAAGCAGPGADRLAGPEVEVRTVHLDGTFTTAYRGRPPRGAYGLRVHLLFRRADGSGWDGARAPDGPSRRHRQVDVLDEAGRFRFDFATSMDLSAYDEVAVVPATDAEAARLVPTPRGAGRIGTPEGPVAVLPVAEAIRVPLPPSGPVTASALHAEARPEVGVVVRWATLGREFVGRLYDGAPPFDLPTVQVELSPRGGYVFQAFDPDAFGGHEIELNVARGVTAALVGHEYGHYVSFRMWGASPWRYTLRNRNLREGWAIFFSFAVRAYAAQTYGDADLAPSNPERAPFTDRLGAGARYEGISYGTTRPDYAAIGALLWSLYDGPEASPFESTALDAGSLLGDNDDLAFGRDLFEAARRSRAGVLDEAGIVEVVRALKAEAPADLHASIDGAFDFFLCPAFPACDVKAPVDASPSTGTPTLRSVSPGALTVRRISASAVGLAWDRRLYTAPWANAPTAYRVYRDGTPIATLPPSTETYVDPEAAGAHVYEVRAVNEAGESTGAPSVRVGAASGVPAPPP